MLCTYALKVSAEQFNELKVYGYSITPMVNFPGKTTDITLKNRHTLQLLPLTYIFLCTEEIFDILV